MHHSIFFVIDLNELSKTTRIVVVHRLGIAKSLQEKGETIYAGYWANESSSLEKNKAKVNLLCTRNSGAMIVQRYTVF